VQVYVWMVGNLPNRWINKGQQIVHIDISKAERQYNAEYVADLCLKSPNGGFSEEPFSVFWQETPPQPNFSNYFGLFIRMRTVMIVSAHSVVDGTWEGAEAEDGEIIFSRYRHDSRVSRDQSAMVDGGRDYFRFRGKPVNLRVVGPDFEIL
jgi:hypothetical protein